MSLISPVHILFIAAFALIFLGPKRLPDLARGLGIGMREFRDSLNGDIHRRAPEALDAAAAAAEHPEQAPERVAPAPSGPFA
jgi:sec-independent protein translocase protein TatA